MKDPFFLRMYVCIYVLILYKSCASVSVVYRKQLDKPTDLLTTIRVFTKSLFVLNRNLSHWLQSRFLILLSKIFTYFILPSAEAAELCFLWLLVFT